MPTVLITGANRGLGLGLTKHYALDGWQVIATCRDPGQSDDLNAFAASNDKVSVHALNVTDAASVAALKRDLGDRPIDLLFNNAGRLGNRARQAFGDIDYDSWRAELEVNLLGPTRVVESFVDNVAASDRKQVAVVSSAMGSLTEAAGGYYPYRTSKAAVNMAVRAMATDLANLGISVFTFHPGWVRTNMGGPSAAVSPEDSAAGLAKVLAGLGPQDTGRFLRYDGGEIDW